MRNPKWHRDEIILALDLYFDRELGSIDSKNPKIIALSELLNGLSVIENRPDENKFRNPNGVALKLSNFKAMDPSYAGKGMSSFSKLDKQVFDEFNGNKILLHKIASDIKQTLNNPQLMKEISKVENDENIDRVKEGQVLFKLHKIRERNSKIIQSKKNRVLQEQGTLKCEVCDFDFEEFYGELGRGYIECHHLTPLSEYNVQDETRLEDLALLCSNCHRMIHRELGVSTVIEFRRKILKLS
jgi:5-methylcytosine-specific restriction protein A